MIRSAFVLDSSNLGSRVAVGAGYTFLGIALRTLLTIGSMAILARLLVPADFGYVAMASVVTEFASLLGGFGFVNILIQRRVINRLQLDTAFWTSAAVGATLTSLVFLLSFAAAWFYSDPLTGELLRVMCLAFLVNSLFNVHEAIIGRLMRFKIEFFIQLFAITVRAVSAILLAHYGFGVWSLVFGGLAGSITSLACYAIVVPYVPRFRFHKSYVTSNLKTSGSYFGSGFLYYLNTNIDLVLIGRSIGATSLGYYQNARSLTDEVRARIAMPLQRVLFPAFSAIQKDQERLQQSVSQAGSILAAVIIPVGVGMSAVAPELVPVLYGDKWLPMIPILTFFGLSAAAKGSTAIASTLFNSQNRVALAFKYNLIGTVINIAGIALAIPYGIVWVAVAGTVYSLYSVFMFKVGLGLIQLSTRQSLRILAPPTVAAIVMWLTIVVLRPYLAETLPSLGLLLASNVVLGACVYAVILNVLSPDYLRLFKKLLARLRSRD